jgi:hypothetical protein
MWEQRRDAVSVTLFARISTPLGRSLWIAVIRNAPITEDKMDKKCRHKEIMVCDEVVKCCSCGKVWLQHNGNVFRDLSFRAGGL